MRPIRLVSMLLGCALLALSAPVRAQDVAAAANAFAQGQRAELAGQYARAAEFYEIADGIAPTPEALRAAVKARRAAGDLGGAASGAERLLLRYPQDARSREIANEVLSAARVSLMRVTVDCATPCGVVIDGFATGTSPKTSHVLYVTPGDHTLYATFNEGRTPDHGLSAEASGEAELRWSASDVPPRPGAALAAEPVAEDIASEGGSEAQAAGSDAPGDAEKRAGERRGMSPIGFTIAAAATAALGAVTIWSAVDVKNAADDFRSDPTPTQGEFDDGERKDLRTNVLFGVTMAGVATTALLAYFTFRRRGGSQDSARVPAVQLTADRSGAGLLWKGAF